MATVKTPTALLVQVEQNYSMYRAVARVVLPQEDGELHNPTWSGSYGKDESAHVFDGLEISAYAGRGASDYPSDTDDKLWGFGVHYSPHRIENARHAGAIARVMARIERGMDKAQAEDGYIRDGEFARYVMRVGRAAGIRQVYVRTLPGQFRVTGERYRLADATALDYWCQEVTESIIKRELATLIR